MELRNKIGQHKIAIVGTGSLFPGAVDTKDFWLNILAEKDFIRDVPETHWLKEDYYDPTDKTGDKVYCKKGAFLNDVSFDPVEFGMPPNLLSTTDTVQLLSLLVARDTLADTVSYQAGKVDKRKVSVILGVAGGTELIGQMSARIHKPEWVMAMRKQGLPESKIEAITADLDNCYTKWTENTFPGLLGNVVSGRIANRFDLKGTNCVLDAACASSLAAVKMAVQELQLGTTDMVISGGADALNDIFMYMCFSKTTALSPTEDCRPFSDEGDGTVLGEAVVMLALKRLEDAERDGDRIYAVISSIGSSSDGKSGSIYAPDSNGQSLAIKRAYEQAGVTPEEISLVEGHGTGTLAGDYSEFNGLKLAYGETEQKQYCALGSVKSMIGHTKSAAGAASLLKVAMALNNAVLPPTLKVKQPSPKLNIEDSPFYLNTVARPWIHDEHNSRKAGVSSMGFGGTNFHVVMEEYDNKEHRPNKLYKAGRELLLLSGKSKAEVIAAVDKLVSSGQDQNIVQSAKTTQATFNSSDNCRLAILGENITEVFKWAEHAKSTLAKNVSPIDVNNSVYYAEGNVAGKVAFCFQDKVASM
jgi:acyl transferase domain-containing protein